MGRHAVVASSAAGGDEQHDGGGAAHAGIVSSDRMEEPALGEVLAAYGLPTDGARACRAPSGLIQKTWFVDLADGRRVVAQEMHPIFAPAVLDDTEAVTAHVQAAGLETPRLLRTPGGDLGTRDAAGRLWRIMTYLDGTTIERVDGPARALEAAALVARFHRATSDLERPFAFVRPGAHDTAAHLARLERALADGGAVPGYDRIAPVAEAILDEARRRPALPPTVARVAHGDLKISNVLFDAAGARARALLDLDTLGHLTIAYELGDAWRSWCNPEGEDTTEPRFDREIFAAAARGYARAAGGLLGPDEVASLVPGVITVALELAARFCVDAFEDRYFGWDPARFPSRREHNVVRAAGQLVLARQVAAARAAAEAIVASEFTGVPS